MKITKHRNRWRVSVNGKKHSFATYEEATVFVKTQSSIKLWDILSVSRPQKPIIPTINFDNPIALCFLSDLHIGSKGVDYYQLRKDAEIIAKTDGMYAVFHGDGIDNWIIPKLSPLQRGQAISFDDEWAIFQAWLETLGSKLQVVVAGNHDNWTYKLSGIDFLKHILSPIVLYDQEQIIFDAKVGSKTVRICVRHKWRGYSIYNVTHGIERSARDIDADIYVGGHFHVATLGRWFTVRERDRLAIITSTYKVQDQYAKTLGLPPSQHHGACAVIIDDKSSDIIFIRNLQQASEYITYKRRKV